MWDDDLCRSFLPLLVTVKVPGVLETHGVVLEGKGMEKERALLLAFSCRLSCPIRPLAFLVPLELAPEEKGLEREMARAGGPPLSCFCRQFYPIHPLLLSAPLGLVPEEKGVERADVLFLFCSCRQYYPVHPLLLSVPLELLAAAQRALVTLKRWECVFDAVPVQARSRSLMLWLRLPLKALLVEQDFPFWVFALVAIFCLFHVEVLVWEGFLVAR